MTTRQYVEQPATVSAEQFFDAADPPIAGVHRCGLSPFLESGPAHVHLAGARVVMLHDGDWITYDIYTGEPIRVLTDEQFLAQYRALTD